MLLPTALLLLLIAPQILASRPAKRFYDSHDYYVLEHDPTAPYAASLLDVSRVLGVEVIEQAGELMNHWLVRVPKPEIVARNAGREDAVTATFHRLRALAREAPSSHRDSRSTEYHDARGISNSVRYLALQTPRQRVKRAPPPPGSNPNADPASSKSQDVATHFGIQDPLFPEQWHLVNNEYSEHSMNVTGVWEMGFTGKGVIASMVDDGVDYESEDLKDNFVSLFTAFH